MKFQCQLTDLRKKRVDGEKTLSLIYSTHLPEIAAPKHTIRDGGGGKGEKYIVKNQLIDSTPLAKVNPLSYSYKY